MKFSEFYHLGKQQRELDFVDILLETDTPLFIDPLLISRRIDKWSIDTHSTIRSYFQFLINTIKEDRIDEAADLFSYLHEPNETKLGLSTGQSQGKGMGAGDTERVFRRLLNSKAIQTGLVEDLEDAVLFVEKVGPDKISDMTTNIIKKQLIAYTQKQCNLLDIPLTADVPSGFYWNRASSEWEAQHTDYLVTDNKRILLVPKAIVCYKSSYTPSRFHQHFILNFLQADHIRRRSAFVKTRTTRKGVTTKYVLKKELKESVAPPTKDFIRKFSIKHPRVLEDYKVSAAAASKPLDHQAFESFNVDQFCDFLLLRLNDIELGKRAADEYHRFIIGLLDFLLYPDLVSPEKEERIHQGRKRIDISFDNAAQQGFFNQLHSTKGIPSQYIIFECKNYSEDPANPEVDQVAGRFSPNRGQFGVLVCRNINDEKLLIKRCVDTYTDHRGLVLFLTDDDFKNALEEYKNGQKRGIQNQLTKRMREVIMQ